MSLHLYFVLNVVSLNEIKGLRDCQQPWDYGYMHGFLSITVAKCTSGKPSSYVWARESSKGKCSQHHMVRMVGTHHLSPRGTAEVYPGRLGSPGPDLKSGSVGRGQDAQLHDEEASLVLW